MKKRRKFSKRLTVSFWGEKFSIKRIEASQSLKSTSSFFRNRKTNDHFFSGGFFFFWEGVNIILCLFFLIFFYYYNYNLILPFFIFLSSSVFPSDFYLSLSLSLFLYSSLSFCFYFPYRFLRFYDLYITYAYEVTR